MFGSISRQSSNLAMTPPYQHYLTIEDLRSTRNSCWLCGCNWQQDHVSLDCPECDGYALSRPCPSCDGKCKQIWRRNINATHDSHKALWMGQCSIFNNDNTTTNSNNNGTAATTNTPANGANGGTKIALLANKIAKTTMTTTATTTTPTNTATMAPNGCLVGSKKASSCCSSASSSDCESDSQQHYQ